MDEVIPTNVPDAGTQLHFQPLGGEIQGRFFLNFPINPIARLGSPTIRLRVVAWYADAQGQAIDEGHLVTETGRVLVGEDTSAPVNSEMPEGAVNVFELSPISDYHRDDGQWHMGADYNMVNGRPMREGDALYLPALPGATMRVVDVGDVNGYGTMAVKLEITFDQQRTFRNEVDMHTLIMDAGIERDDFSTRHLGTDAMPALVSLQQNPALLSRVRGMIAEYNTLTGEAREAKADEIAAAIGVQTTITTNRIDLFFGHLRPSRDVRWIDDDHERFLAGQNELSYNRGDVVSGPLLLGYLEKGDLDWDTNTPGRTYAGTSWGTHTHGGAYAPSIQENLPDDLRARSLWSGVASSFSILRTAYIRPEDLRNIIS